MGTLLKLLSERDVEFLREFDLTDIFKRELKKYSECLEWIKIHFEMYFTYKINQLDYYKTPEMHCSECDINTLTRNAFAIFMSLKLKNYLIDQLPFFIDQDKFFLNSNQLVFRKVEETTSVIKMKKIYRKARVFDKDSLEAYHGRLISEQYPADILQIDDNTCFVLESNGKIIEIEQFPHNIDRMAKIYFLKGTDPVKMAKNCHSKIKILATLFSAGIDYNTHYFFNDNEYQYFELIPLQIIYWNSYVSKGNFENNFNSRARRCLEFLENIDHTKFGTGVLTRRMLYIWMASKQFEKMSMKNCMTYLRVHLHFDTMDEIMHMEMKIVETIKNIWIEEYYMPPEVTLNQYLDHLEEPLIAQKSYIKYTSHHCRFKTIDI